MRRAAVRCRAGLVAGLAVALWAGSGCRRAAPVQPPQIVYGMDVCARCDMIINDERFAAGAVVRENDGSVQSYAFDDIGCLLDFERSRSRGSVLGLYVKAYATKQWCEAHAAVYLHSPRLHTPMASGLAACPDAQGAAQLRQEFPGDVLAYAALDSTRRGPAESAPARPAEGTPP